MSNEFAEMIGVSTAVLAADLDENLKVMERAGFKTVEILAGDFSKKKTIWPRAWGIKERKDLKRQLQGFSSVLVHAPKEGVNICSINHGWREESIRQYLECIEFAYHIGAKIVTFHPGTQTWGNISSPGEIINGNIEFGKRALASACKYDLKLAFESVNISLPELKEVMDKIDDVKFGVDLNLGAVAKSVGLPGDERDITREIQSWLGQFKGKITAIHISGVHQRWHLDRLDLCPFEMNNCIDYFSIVRELKRNQYQGPIVLEIVARDLDAVIRYCQSAKQELLFHRDGSKGKR